MKTASGNSITAPVRQITAKVELYNGSTLVDTYYNNDIVKSVDIERVGEMSKFFGFGVCQKANIVLLDKERALDISTANSFKVYFKTTESSYVNVFPTFNVSEVHRDETNNELSITCYDGIKKADEHTVAELELSGTTALIYWTAAKDVLGYSGVYNLLGDTTIRVDYGTTINYDGTETLRTMLNQLAEVTQGVYFLNGDDKLVLKRLSQSAVDLTVDKSQYFTLESSGNKRLSTIISTTELGDNVSVTTGVTGSTQYVRSNAFWELNENLATYLDTAIANVGGMTIAQLSCSWRGNYLTEVGDRVAFITKDNETIYTYILNDVISYNGSLSQRTEWSYSSDDNSVSSSPNTIGEALNETYARVDKVNKKIDLVVADSSNNSTETAGIHIELDKITETVNGLADTVDDSNEKVNANIAELYNRVSTVLTKDEYAILVEDYIRENGVNKVITTNGYYFKNDGLLIDERDADGNRISETATKLSNDGMKVYNKDDEEMLSATSWGVNAKNLHATTYLIIGDNSRFEDYSSGERTGCFWVGG